MRGSEQLGRSSLPTNQGPNLSENGRFRDDQRSLLHTAGFDWRYDAFAESNLLDFIGLDQEKSDIEYFLSLTTKVICEHAFDGCTHLSTVLWNDGLQKIEICAFGDCKSLQSIKISSTVSEIEGDAFFCCACLRDVILHDTMHKSGLMHSSISSIADQYRCSGFLPYQVV